MNQQKRIDELEQTCAKFFNMIVELHLTLKREIDFIENQELGVSEDTLKVYDKIAHFLGDYE